MRPSAIDVDPAGSGVFEPGKVVPVEPAWRYSFQISNTGCASNNPCPPTAIVGGTVSNFSGPAGADYTVVDDAADYGTIGLNTAQNCNTTGNCYKLSVSAPNGRPSPHWDATVEETTISASSPSPMNWILPLSGSVLEPESCPIVYGSATWTLHIGSSFVDVATSDGFYPFIENLFHHGVTAGCDVNQYCPSRSIRRDQMAVFLLRSKYGQGYAPPPCGGAFADVSCPGPFTDWVEQVYAEGIIAGCGGGNYCPNEPVERRDMAPWLLKAQNGSEYVPPAATGLFADVPVDDADAPWIEELYRRQITAGCNASPLLYCPDRPNTRGQMAVFVVKTWGLRLY